MAEITAGIVINAPAALVFDYATTPANGPNFWPVTRVVSGDVDTPAQMGARWTEQVKISIWRGEFFWEAAECTRPRTFLMRGTSQTLGFAASLMPRAAGQIAYTLTETNGQTHFLRVMNYEEPTVILKLLGILVMRRAMRKTIHQALQNLKTIVEAMPASGARP
jgi:uncharacterized protein YndB with AHSA1/START domain